MTIEKALSHLGLAQEAEDRSDLNQAEHQLLWSIAESLAVIARQGEAK